ncbi:MAG TPA: hypothetical protein VK846_00230 [Candidatus Limnocylindria bacterium]|nr:hypothetical protein [Candidatus Limnocylindria bacterium]
MQRRAAKEKWPTQREGNRILLQPPPEIMALVESYQPAPPVTKIERAFLFDDVCDRFERAGRALRRLREEYEARARSILRTVTPAATSTRGSSKNRNATGSRENAMENFGR